MATPKATSDEDLLCPTQGYLVEVLADTLLVVRLCSKAGEGNASYLLAATKQLAVPGIEKPGMDGQALAAEVREDGDSSKHCAPCRALEEVGHGEMGAESELHATRMAGGIQDGT